MDALRFNADPEAGIVLQTADAAMTRRRCSFKFDCADPSPRDLKRANGAGLVPVGGSDQRRFHDAPLMGRITSPADAVRAAVVADARARTCVKTPHSDA
jgi:hypothetical protein